MQVPWFSYQQYSGWHNWLPTLLSTSNALSTPTRTAWALQRRFRPPSDMGRMILIAITRSVKPICSNITNCLGTCRPSSSAMAMRTGNVACARHCLLIFALQSVLYRNCCESICASFLKEPRHSFLKGALMMSKQVKQVQLP